VKVGRRHFRLHSGRHDWHRPSLDDGSKQHADTTLIHHSRNAAVAFCDYLGLQAYRMNHASLENSRRALRRRRRAFRRSVSNVTVAILMTETDTRYV